MCPSKHHGPPPPPPPPPPYPVKPPIGYTNNLGFDPGIDGPPGAGPARWIQPNSGLGYTIHFQNDPSASASVAQVWVTEPVPPDVDPASVQLTGFGYGSTAVVVPAGHQSFTETLPDSAPNGDGDTVNVTGSYDQATSTITWTMTAINPATGDADTSATGGFLPPDSLPNRDGEGYVSFTVNPKAGLATGTEVTAAASIVFDRNSAISTPTWTNTIDGTTPTARVCAAGLDHHRRSLEGNLDRVGSVRIGRVVLRRVRQRRWPSVDPVAERGDRHLSDLPDCRRATPMDSPRWRRTESALPAGYRPFLKPLPGPSPP